MTDRHVFSKTLNGATAATQTEMEAATSNTAYGTALNIKWNPGVAKSWIRFNGQGVVSIGASLNITSLTDDAVGKYTVTLATDHSSGQYAAVGSAKTNDTAGNDTIIAQIGTVLAGSYTINTASEVTTLTDCVVVSGVTFGDQ